MKPHTENLKCQNCGYEAQWQVEECQPSVFKDKVTQTVVCPQCKEILTGIYTQEEIAAGMKCPKCGAEVTPWNPIDHRCPQCGGPMTQA